MNSTRFLSTFGTVMSTLLIANLIGCAAKNPPNPNAPKAATPGEEKEQVIGLQPGKITLNGVIAESARQSANANGPIKVSAKGGVDEKGVAAPVSKENETVLNATVPAVVVDGLKKPMALGAIAFGCTDEQKRIHLGDTSGEPEKVLGKTEIVAGRVLLCGNNPLNKDETTIVINAKEVILVDAVIKQKNPAGLSIQTLILTVVGTKNQLSSGPASASADAATDDATDDATGAATEDKALTDETVDTAKEEAAGASTTNTGGPINLTVVEKLNIENAMLLIATHGDSVKKAAAAKK